MLLEALTKIKTALSMSKLSHLQRTSKNFRQDIVTKATIAKTSMISPTVKQLELTIIPETGSESDLLGFYAGQWIDLFIPGLKTVGGFSMCSAPFQLLEKPSFLCLAVKFSEHPPAKWIHEKCKPGDKVELKFGGEFYYRPEADTANSSLLLIGGGVGINPLCSIALETAHFDHTNGVNRRISILNSASTTDELLFKEKLQDLSSENVLCKFYVTQQTGPAVSSHKFARMTFEDLQTEFLRLKSANQSVRAFICGPPPLILFVETSLKELGMSSELIHYENWW